MANLSIRNLDDDVHAALRLEAARAGISVEEQARRMLAAGVGKTNDPETVRARRAAALAKIRGDLNRLVPDPRRSIVDEFLADRRAMWGEE